MNVVVWVSDKPPTDFHRRCLSQYFGPLSTINHVKSMGMCTNINQLMDFVRRYDGGHVVIVGDARELFACGIPSDVFFYIFDQPLEERIEENPYQMSVFRINHGLATEEVHSPSQVFTEWTSVRPGNVRHESTDLLARRFANQPRHPEMPLVQ